MGFFDWLRGKAFEGGVEKYPEVGDGYTTPLERVYVIGDLTGLPLLKFASLSGEKVWESIGDRTTNSDYDVVIVGGGVSGMACAAKGISMGKKVLVLEAGQSFQTVKSYPANKPIFAEPKNQLDDLYLKIQNGSKESLLVDLKTFETKNKIPILENKRVVSLSKDTKGNYIIVTEDGSNFLTSHVVLAMGKSGDPRKLGVIGESLSHVYYRLIDPQDFKDKTVVIVGGGDSALESAIALSKTAQHVTLIHRKSGFDRAKESNRIEWGEAVSRGMSQLLESEVREILPNAVIVSSKSEPTKKIKSDAVLILIGSEAPLDFLKKLGIPISGEKGFKELVGLVSVLGFAMLAYLGKASFYGNDWYSTYALIGICFTITFGLCWLYLHSKDKGWSFPQGWSLFRNMYLVFAFLYFGMVYFLARYADYKFLEKLPSFHFTMLYSATILIFGIRRIIVRPTQYIKFQTISLILVQVFPLFLLPEVILPFLGKMDCLGSESGLIRSQLFPKEAYWFAYRFVLAWPLNLGALYGVPLTSFWFYYGLFLTFILIPFLVWRYGKGAYCGWICSCGGLAETLGDEHRQKMPHSKFAYKIEHSGQFVLLFAFIFTIAKWIEPNGLFDSIKWIYDLVVDIGLAGVIGLGIYFFASGRIWCRMYCPLAALMHIYAKFSQFRIFSDKKKCISCNVCTKVCHQGIDVMGFANKGIPMDSVQCVRCSACVSQCPTGVLTFGRETKNGPIFDRINGTL